MGSEPAGDGRGAVARGRRPAGSGTREAILALDAGEVVEPAGDADGLIAAIAGEKFVTAIA